MGEIRFDDRVVVVTGAGRGIGRAHALAFAGRGATVVVADYGVAIDGGGSSSAPADEVVEEIRAAGGAATACIVDVSDEQEATGLVSSTLDAHGRLDAVVTNAGINDPDPFEALSTERFRRMMDVHFFGTLFVAQAAWRHFRSTGTGRIVTTTSEAMLGGVPQLTSYGAAKGAVFGLTRNLATEATGTGISVNAVAPRAHTRMSGAESERLAEVFGMDDESIALVNASMPPEMCSPAVLYLAHESCELNGEVLRVGMGSITRLAVIETVGSTSDAATPEGVAEQMTAILDVTGGQVRGAASMAI